MVNSPVLVLNQNYEPLNVSRARRAVVLLLQGKAEALENGSGVLHTPNEIIPLPSVIRLVYLVKRPPLKKKLTRREVFRRDKYTCQYCGRETRELTLDHVIPRHKGGRHTWENVVSACIPCNNHKAGRTPQEAGMRLIRQPFSPHVSGYYVPREYIQRHNEWQRFLPLWQTTEED
ncbi:MAG: HNH endonuclease [Dehalococcoidia bacterium]|nr:HNH endonuclease [Dehalococcoidia bacterium]